MKNDTIILIALTIPVVIGWIILGWKVYKTMEAFNKEQMARLNRLITKSKGHR